MRDKVEFPILSLCIPTNGMAEWVCPVLDSIYNGFPEESRFEVVIEDNGNNADFEELIRQYQAKYPNIQYFRSTAQGFLCQIDCFRHAQGKFVKFVNHRAKLVNGALDYLIQFAVDNLETKPVVFFSNGRLDSNESESFDQFVAALGYWSSWSGGLAFWKEDIEDLKGEEDFNVLFPHTDILFKRRDAGHYAIVDKKLFEEIDSGHSAKGKYNLFGAFSLEYLSIIADLLRNGDVSPTTFLCVKNRTLDFLADLYIDFILRKKPASYSFDNCREYLSVYYSEGQRNRAIMKRLFVRSFGHFISRIRMN